MNYFATAENKPYIRSNNNQSEELLLLWAIGWPLLSRLQASVQKTCRAFVKLFLPMIDNNNQYIHYINTYIHTYIIYIYISYFCSVPTIQGFIITCWEFKTIMIINMVTYWWFFFYFSYNFVILSVNVPCIFSNKKVKI